MPVPYFVVTCAALIACQETPSAVLPPLAITVSPLEVWGGAEVDARSAQLAHLPLARSGDYALLLDEDTLDAWRPDSTTVAAMLPPAYSGQYWLTLVLADGRRDSASIRVIGESRPNRYVAGPIQAVGLGNSTAVGAARWAVPWGYGLLDLDHGTLATIPGLGSTQGEIVPRMYVPGLTYRAGYVVVDMGDRSLPRAPQVWHAGQTVADFWFDHALECPHPVQTAFYTAAELQDGACLLLDGDGTVFRDTLEVLADSGLAYGEFRFSEDAAWTIIVTRYRMQMHHRHLHAWPILRGAGDVAYTLSGLAEVPGAAFSPGADTLYAVVARLDSATDSLLWSADMFETATGQLLASLPFPDAVELVDVVLDPELDRVYVPYRTEQRTVNGEDTGCFMAVLDKALSSRIAAVPAREILFSNGRGGAAQFDRTTKELHVMHFGTGNEAIKIHTYDTR